jgi:hypothetical protein
MEKRHRAMGCRRLEPRGKPFDGFLDFFGGGHSKNMTVTRNR